MMGITPRSEHRMIKKMAEGGIAVGTALSFNDPTITEALCSIFDYIWIDMEHNPLTLDAVQGHIMATKGTDVTPIVRVPWNDPVLIKPVLDIGAAGVIVPFVRTAEEARQAVAACLYPPAGIRGFGPRRPSQYGQIGGPEYCQAANESIMTIIQIEHIDAVNNMDEILAVPGLTAIMIGSNDLSGSMGLMGQPRHPEVLAAIDSVIEKTLKTDLFLGIALGEDPEPLKGWMDKGVQWLNVGNDFSLMLRAANDVAGQLRDYAGSKKA